MFAYYLVLYYVSWTISEFLFSVLRFYAIYLYCIALYLYYMYMLTSMLYADSVDIGYFMILEFEGSMVMYLFRTVGYLVVSIGSQMGPAMRIIETINSCVYMILYIYIYIYVYSCSSYLHKYIALWVKLRWHGMIDVHTLLRTMPSISWILRQLKTNYMSTINGS